MEIPAWEILGIGAFKQTWPTVLPVGPSLLAFLGPIGVVVAVTALTMVGVPLALRLLFSR